MQQAADEVRLISQLFTSGQLTDRIRGLGRLYTGVRTGMLALWDVEAILRPLLERLAEHNLNKHV